MMTTNQATSTEAAPGLEPGFLATHQASVSAAFAGLDCALEAARPIDPKTDKLIRFALSIQARSEPCVRSHLAGAAEAGASEADIGYVLALTRRLELTSAGLMASSPS